MPTVNPRERYRRRAFYKGRTAFFRGVKRTDNPYQKTPRSLWGSWDRGWVEACERFNQAKQEHGL